MYRPLRVQLAFILLWMAWGASLVALFINQVFFHGSGIGHGQSLGILTLILQAVVFVFVAPGKFNRSDFDCFFLVLAALRLQMLERLVAEGSIWSAIYTALAFLFRATAVLSLFTAESQK